MFCTSARSKCISGDPVFAFTGDTIFHGSLYVQAFKETSVGDFQPLWAEALPHLQQADFIFTNIEGPIAPGLFPSGKEDPSLAEVYDPENGMYSLGTAGKSYTFNFHPASVRALINDGFNIFSTANNHSLDRGVNGLDKTLGFLRSLNVRFTGTKHKNEASENYVTMLEKNGIKLSVVACSYGSNAKNAPQQLLSCFSGGKSNPELISLVKLFSQRSHGVIVSPHWGTEYAGIANKTQKMLAQDLVQAGAIAILGHHPHVIQPIEFLNGPSNQKVPVVYSLGNFVSNQAPSNWRDPQKQISRFKRRIGAVAFFGLSLIKNKAVVTNIKLMPTYMKIIHEGKKGMRKLLPAYPSIFNQEPNLHASLIKAQEFFLSIFPKKYIVTNVDLLRGVVCEDN